MSVMTATPAAMSKSGKVRLQLDRKAQIAEGVCQLTLSDPAGRRLPDWTPGSHIDLTLPNGLTRQYSLVGDRWDPYRYEVAVLREPSSRGGSLFIHDELAEGDVIEVGGPRNNFAMVPSERFLFIAGGIGITPLIPMMKQADMLGTPWTLLYGGRTRPSMAFLDALGSYGDRVEVLPQDVNGHLPLSRVFLNLETGTKVYACGPAPMLDAVREAAAGLPRGHLRIEQFTARERSAPMRSAPFEVELARSGTVIEVPVETSVLDAVSQAGATILASCRQGTCGTCETRILAGTPDHRDSLITDDEREKSDCFYPCVSRSVSDRLVIDA